MIEMEEIKRELIKKHLEDWTGLKQSSIEHFAKSGKASGSFFMALKDMLDDYDKQLRLHNVSVSLPTDPMVLAKYLHDNYEQIAKRTNWQTQKNCKVEFEDLPIENKNTMILLACKLILDFVGNER